MQLQFSGLKPTHVCISQPSCFGNLQSGCVQTHSDTCQSLKNTFTFMQHIHVASDVLICFSKIISKVLVMSKFITTSKLLIMISVGLLVFMQCCYPHVLLQIVFGILKIDLSARFDSEIEVITWICENIRKCPSPVFNKVLFKLLASQSRALSLLCHSDMIHLLQETHSLLRKRRTSQSLRRIPL